MSLGGTDLSRLPARSTPIFLFLYSVSIWKDMQVVVKNRLVIETYPA